MPGQNRLLRRVSRTEPDRRPGERNHLVLAAGVLDPVARPQHRRARERHRAPAGRTSVPACSGTDRSTTRSPHHSRWNNAGNTAIGSPTASAPTCNPIGVANICRSVPAIAGTSWRGCR